MVSFVHIKKLRFKKHGVSAINIEAECCLDPENRKKNIILLGTLVISSNFLLQFY